MLLRTILVLLFVAALAEAVVHGAAALAQATLHHRAVAATRALFADQIAAAQTAIAAVAGAKPAAPQPLATCAYADAGGCAMQAVATVSLATPGPAETPTACPQTDCTIYLQTNSAVNESRVTFHFSAVITARGGATLATRAGNVTFRTFTAPPYAALAGSLDETLDALENGGVGDDGGSSAAGASTLINVQYVPQGASATSGVSGNAWQAQDEHPAQQAPAWDH